MNDKKRRRIKFYSKEDLVSGDQLKKAEALLDSFSLGSDLSLNDSIEYYNIKLYFDNQLFLTTWTEPQKTTYKDVVEKVYKLLKEKIYTITSNTLEDEVIDLSHSYHDDFWMLLNNLNDCKKISEQAISNILQANPMQIQYVLKQKKLVQKYDRTIREFLVNYSKSAEILLSSLEEKSTFRKREQLYFPKSLSLFDKETIVNSYLDREAQNLNYVRLIENSRDTSEFKLGPKIRLKAKRKSKELNDKIFSEGHTWNIGVGVTFNRDQIEPVKFKYEGRVLEASYSESFLDKFTDNINLFLVFKYLFLYTDDKNLISLISKQNELNVLERTVMKSKNEYEAGFAFYKKENLSNLQLHIFEHYLNRKDNNLESVINSYVDYINTLISPNMLVFQLPMNNTSFLEKIRIVTPDFESLLKQFKSLVDEKCIDFELIQIDSTPLRLSEIPSNKAKKYIYSNDKLILQLQYLFFSDQSHLHYVKHFDDKWDNFYDLITNENVKFDYFENYQKVTIETLIKDEYLELNNEDYLFLKEDILIYLVGELYKREVLSYWDYPESHRKKVDELIEQGLLVDESTLFTSQEKNYFNYYLNKKEFTNGYDLRNKYLHGTNTFSEDEHKLNYYRLLKLIILTLLKIEDDIISK